MAVTAPVVKRIEGIGALDKIVKPMQRLVQRIVEPTAVRNALSGTWLGHPLHPLLTDVPIGAWLAAGVLDTLAPKSSSRASTVLVGTGIAAAVPTALSGLNDWSDTMGEQARLGIAHAAGNVMAVSLFTASLANRLRGDHAAGRALGYAGLAAMVAGAYIGGHLSFVQGVNVNRTAFEERPADWTSVADDAELAEGATLQVRAGGAPVMLHRRAGRLYALADTCTHLGGPLSDGSIDGDCVTCPWHGSVFRLDDGSVVRGPARTPQPVYEARVVGGKIEVRASE